MSMSMSMGMASIVSVYTDFQASVILNMVLPVPITSQRNSKWEVLKGETTLIQDQDTQGKNTFWRFAPQNLLMVQSIRDEEPRFAEVDSQYFVIVFVVVGIDEAVMSSVCGCIYIVVSVVMINEAVMSSVVVY